MVRITKIRVKLLIAQLATAIPAGILVFIVAFFGAKNAITEIRMEQLTAVRAAKASEIESYFERIRGDIVTLSHSTMTESAMLEFTDAFSQLRSGSNELDATRDDLVRHYEQNFLSKLAQLNELAQDFDFLVPQDRAAIYLQTQYLSDNPFPVGSKNLLEAAEDGSNYSHAHAKYHQNFNNYLTEFGYYDIFLISMEGTIVYSVFKEIDFATNLLDGPHSESGLGEAFRAVLGADSAELVQLIDYTPYTPSYDSAASFIASPVMQGSKQVGVLAFQMPIAKIDEIMTGNGDWLELGLGKTGETYLVGSDYKMRSMSRFLLQDREAYFNALEASGVDEDVIEQIELFGTSILLQDVRTLGVTTALEGNSGTDIILDYRQVPVLSSHAPINIEGVNWVILSEIDEGEVFEPITKFTRLLLGIVAIAIVFMVVVAITSARRMVKPIETLDKAVHQFAARGTAVEVKVDSNDELGRLATGFNHMTQAIEAKSATLRENEARTRAIVNSAVDAIITIDDQGIIESFNPAAEDMLGYTQHEVLGKNVSMLMPSPDRENHDGYLEAYHVSGDPKVIGKGREVVAQNKNGDLIDVQLAVSETKLDSGERIYTALLKDIREIKRYREELEYMVDERTSELSKLTKAVEQSPSSVVITDTSGKIEYVNPKLVELCGYSAEELLGENPRILRSDQHSEDFYKNMWKTILEGDIWRGEVCNRKRSGDLYWVSVAIAPSRNDEGEITHFVGVQEDITDRRRKDEELRQAKEDAEQANRAKSTFLANMSHELRTPMNAIIGYSEMLSEDAEDDGNEEIIPDLKKIHSSGKHLLALINDILDLSKIEAGKMELCLESFDLNAMLTDSLAMLQPLVIKNGNELVTEFAPDVGMVRADLTKLKQALFNLVSNAAKFTSKGKITIKARRIDGTEDDQVLLDVMDTGIGIPEEKLDRVFEEFGQADETTTREYGGTGLGLPISRKFCQMMGGELSVKSQAGIGSTFTITIPAEVKDPGAQLVQDEVSADETEALQSTGLHPVLVIDDDPNARDLISRMLTAEGYAVSTAKDGEEGLALAKQLKPSAITLDVQMPGMDGWTVLKQLKDDPELREVPVIMVSIVGDQKTGYALGAVESLPKPIDRESLIEVVGRYGSGSESGTVLVVEDDEANRALLVRVMSQAGWRVIEAENGAVGLKRINEVRPDLILLDLMMPVMDGFEFILELRNRGDCREVPVIVVTAKDLSDEDRFRLTGGVERIIQKGAFSKESFLSEVSDLIHKHNMDVLAKGTVREDKQ